MTQLKLGNVEPTRDLTFVKDTVDGFLEIAKQEKFNGEYVNIGMKQEISVRALVHTIAHLMKTKVEIVSDTQRVRPAQSEVERLFCENKKLRDSTNWAPKYDLEKGLTETIEWLKHNQNQYKDDIYNV